MNKTILQITLVIFGASLLPSAFASDCALYTNSSITEPVKNPVAAFTAVQNCINQNACQDNNDRQCNLNLYNNSSTIAFYVGKQSMEDQITAEQTAGIPSTQQMNTNTPWASPIPSAQQTAQLNNTAPAKNKTKPSNNFYNGIRF